MAYRKVTEEEFRRWAAQNPGGVARIDGQETQVPAPQARDLGFFGNLARGVTKPLRAVAAMPEYLVQALGAANRGQTGLEPNQFKSIFLTPEEEMSWAKDPVKQAGKSSVGLGAYLVPGGGGAAKTTMGRIGTAAGRGAISGTMSGYGYSEEGQEAQGALSGGALGGILGGALQGVGEVSRGIRAKQQAAQGGARGGAVDYLAKQRGEAIGLDPNRIAKARGTGVDSATRGEDTIRSFFDSMDELGLPTNTSNKASLSADQALGYYGENFNNLLAQTNQPVLGADTTKNILQSVKREVGNNPSVLRSSIYKELNADLLGLGQNYSPGQLNAVREKARNMINWSSSGKMPQSERAAKAFFDSLDETFKATIPESSGLLSKMRDIYTVRPFIQGKAVSADFIPLGTASTNIKIPTAGVNEAVQSGIGRVGEALQGGGALGNLLQGATRVAEPVAGVAQRAIPGIVGAGQSMPQRQQEPQLEGLGSILPPQQQGPQIDRIALVEAVLNGQISTTEANFIIEMLGSQETEGSGLETAISELERLYGAGTAQTLSRGTKSTGIGGLVSGGIAKGKTLLDQDFADRKAAYDQQRAIAVGIINKAREAGVLNEGEYEVMIQNMPNEYTTEKVAQDWFKNVRRMLVNKGSQPSQTSQNDSALYQMLGLQ